MRLRLYFGVVALRTWSFSQIYFFRTIVSILSTNCTVMFSILRLSWSARLDALALHLVDMQSLRSKPSSNLFTMLAMGSKPFYSSSAIRRRKQIKSLQTFGLRYLQTLIWLIFTEFISRTRDRAQLATQSMGRNISAYLRAMARARKYVVSDSVLIDHQRSLLTIWSTRKRSTTKSSERNMKTGSSKSSRKSATSSQTYTLSEPFYILNRSSSGLQRTQPMNRKSTRP